MFVSLTLRRTVTALALLLPLLALLGFSTVARADDDDNQINGLAANSGDPLDSNDYDDNFVNLIGGSDDPDPFTPAGGASSSDLSGRRSIGLFRSQMVFFVEYRFGLPTLRVMLIVDKPARHLEARHAR